MQVDEFTQLDWYVLGFLLEFMHKDSHELMRCLPDRRLGLGSIGVPDEVIRQSVLGLQEKGFVVLRYDDNQSEESLIEDHYPEITPKGIGAILLNRHFYYDNEHGSTWDYPTNAGDVIDSIFDSQTDGGVDIAPSSDGFVRFNHNSEHYMEAIDAVEALIESVDGANNYPESSNLEKEGITSTLRTGLENLRQKVSNVEIIRRALLGVAKYLSVKFADAAIGVAAGICVAALIKLLGIV